MAAKKSAAKPATPKFDPNTLQVTAEENGIAKDMTQSQILAALTARSYQSAPALKAYSGGGADLGVTDMLTEMRKAGDEVVSGDLGRVERMLMNQAMTLDAIFANLAERSSRQEYMKQMETYLKLALKAQAQARATAEALALLKNPQPYIKQANIAQGGNQQINNMYSSASAHSGMATSAENSQLSPNKLLENQDVTTLDTRAPTATGRANQTVETLG